MDVTGISAVANLAGDVIERIWPKDASNEDKLKAKTEVTALMVGVQQAVIGAQEAVTVAELQQEDKFTKRARPSVVYFGLVFIFINHVLPNIFSACGVDVEMQEVELPKAFWYAWTGICSVWAVGRSFEKTGSANKIVKMITGGK